MWMVEIWLPLLYRLDMVHRGWLNLPTATGVLLVTAIYSCGGYLLARCFRRTRTSKRPTAAGDR